MKAFEIKNRAGVVVASGCGVCSTVVQGVSDVMVPMTSVSEECCTPRPCRHCKLPVESDPSRYRRDTHDECVRLMEIERLNAAPLVEWDDCVQCDCCDEYFFDQDGFLDCHDMNEPDRVWHCEQIGLEKIDADRIIEELLEGHHEDSRDELSVNAVNDLQAILDAWLSKQKVVSWFATKSAVDVSHLFAERRAELEESE